MKQKNIESALTSFALFLCFCLVEAVPAFAQPPANAVPNGPINRPPDPRVQQRKYHFADTNEDLPYASEIESSLSSMLQRGN